MKDKIIQIITGIDGEMPGVLNHSFYGLSESGRVYVMCYSEKKVSNEWVLMVNNPELKENK